MNRNIKLCLFAFLFFAFGKNAAAQCEIWEVAAEVLPCDGGVFYVSLNFNFDDTGNEGFSVLGNGNDYGDFEYDDLPIEIGPLEGDNTTEYEFVVIDNQMNDCQDWTSIDPVHCGVGDCAIEGFTATPSDCDGDDTYDVTINFEAISPTHDFFDVIYNGDIIGYYALADLPVILQNFEDNGEPFPLLSVCINDNPNCCALTEFESPQCGSSACHIYDLEVVALECDGDEFWITLNFQFDNVGNDGFTVQGNGTNYGNFSYSDDVPFTLGPLPADDTFYEFVVFDVQHPDCSDVIEHGVVDCPGSGNCEIWDLHFETGDCDPTNGTYNLWINFEYANAPNDLFDVIYDGEIIGTYALADLPVLIENFQDNGENVPAIGVCVNDTANCCEEGEFESPCAVGMCEIWDLHFEADDCDPTTGTYNLWINFEHANATNDFFDVIYDGEVIGYFALADLPVLIENFEDNGENTPAIAVCINDNPNCCAEGEFHSPCNSSTCEIWDLFAEAHECDDDGNFMVDIEFHSNNTGSEGFSIVANGEEFGPFEYGETFYTFGPLSGGVVYEILVVDNEFNDCGGYYQLGPIYCDDQCHIFDLVAETTECDDMGQFYVILDFEYQNVGNDGFKVAGNGNVYGFFDYADLPIEIGPFQTPTNDLEFIVTDVQQPDCGDFVGVDAPNCDPTGGCEIWDLTADVTPCSSNGTFYVILDFEHINTSGIAFSVNGNGISYGFYAYDDLPVSIGPLVGNGITPYEFAVHDILMPDCGAAVEVGSVECDIMGMCEITDLVVDASDCNDDGTFDIWLNFDYQNSPNIYFDVIYDGDVIAYFPLAELPVIIPHFEGNGEPVQEITVCINDTPNCCATLEFEAPDCLGPNIVWPGDTESNHASSHFDLLNIGLAFGFEGPERVVQGIEWTGLLAEQWDNEFPNGLNHVHADCDGNGIVDEADIQALEVNFGETHDDVIEPILIGGNEDDPPFYVDLLGAGALVDGEQFSASIMLGNEDLPVGEMYGVAFTLNFDPQIIDPSSIQIKYDPSWLGVENVNLITFDHHSANDGQVHVALSRSDQNNVSGHGHIAEFIGIIDNIAGKEEVIIGISEVKAITVKQVLVPLNRPEQIAGIVTSTSEPVLGAFKVYPNPASSSVTLVHPNNLNVNSVRLKNVNGSEMKIELAGHNQLDVSDLADGVYFMEIETKEGLFIEKLVKM